MDFDCDGCGKPFARGERVTNVGDAMEVILFCEDCEPFEEDE